MIRPCDSPVKGRGTRKEFKTTPPPLGKAKLSHSDSPLFLLLRRAAHVLSFYTTQAMSGNDSDSSDDDWVITSTPSDVSTSVTTSPSPPTQQPTKPETTTSKRLQRPTVSKATVRTIRASLSKKQLAADPHKTRSAAEINYISQEQLESICSAMDSRLLVRRLVETYKNAETFLRIKDIETAKMTFDARLSETLYLCSDPGCFILVKKKTRVVIE